MTSSTQSALMRHARPNTARLHDDIEHPIREVPAGGARLAERTEAAPDGSGHTVVEGLPRVQQQQLVEQMEDLPYWGWYMPY
eukprot:1602664-Prymnesium_polylepis.1